ncbi:PstS family phosphate ABC transporter substrate-binding protein [Dolichospermum flos-aquae]|uniref:Substrate-binding domain-containing protein n=1 Tax=Dolichospermum flos-aquae LEGE 04289 TaxID=1828708 RepID=A0ACC5PZJ0_DOLFA|nr:substrate-binding domain-containing protein [Dolichospermum flos-aquae]MBE9218772.1 substrate-binding domain-containing protein [Dolichospermum flos-aquae LEGE 04289]
MSPKKETLPLLLYLIATISLMLVGSSFIIFIISSEITSTSPSSVTSCNVPNLPQGIFSYGGSTTWATLRKDVDSVLEKICPQFVLRYIQPLFKDPGSGTGIQMLIDNQLAFTQSSRSIKLEETSQAQQKGFRLKEIIVAIDAIAIAVNHNLNIPGLTTAQIKDIYTGKITNWQKLGGANLPIIPLSRSQEAGGTVDFFIEYVLNKDKFGNNVNYIPTTTEALRKIANTPGGIYYGSAPEIVPQCTIKSLPIGRTNGQFVTPYQQPEIAQSQCPNQRNQLNAENFRNGNYPITRNLFVIIKQNGQSDQQAGEAYANWLLTSQGQELIEKAGFVKIK